MIRSDVLKFKEEFETNSAEGVGGAVHAAFYRKFKTEAENLFRLAAKVTENDLKPLQEQLKKTRQWIQNYKYGFQECQTIVK
jgi:hypothetical protein